MKKVNLVSAQFFRKYLESASVSNLEISLCYLFDLSERDIVFNEIFKQTELIPDSNINLHRGTYEAINEHLAFGILLGEVRDIKAVESFKGMVAAQSGVIAVSIYFDEYEDLLAKIPNESSRADCQKLLSDETLLFS